MKSDALGAGISHVEVTNISAHGLWLLVEDEELFLPFGEFPWFRDAPISAILHVERRFREHVRWPELDVDLTLDAIRDPKGYPLVSSVNDEKQCG